MKKQRLDQLVFDRGLTESRERARTSVMDIAGLVGTLAGDDTAFIAMKDTESAENFEREIEQLL